MNILSCLIARYLTMNKSNFCLFLYLLNGDVFRMDKQWGPSLQHRELYPVSWDRTWWKIVQEKECVYVCIYTALSHIYVHTLIYIHTHIYIYEWLGHFAVQQKLAQHCKSAVLKKKKKKAGEEYVLRLQGRILLIEEAASCSQRWGRLHTTLPLGCGLLSDPC